MEGETGLDRVPTKLCFPLMILPIFIATERVDDRGWVKFVDGRALP
jgi:hypothetical protein